MGEDLVILGAGSWGTALAVHLALKKVSLKLWTRDRRQAELLTVKRINQHYLPGVQLPPEIRVTSELGEALEGVRVIILAIPSQSVREVIRRTRPLLGSIGNRILVNTSKGIENTTGLRISQVIAEEMPEAEKRLAALSGPSHAEEVGRDLPTAVVAAAQDSGVATCVQDLLMSPNFRVYTNSDLVGVELGGALKNIIALGAGIAEGLGFGDNTKAAIITRGLTEMARLGVALGANPLTFLGLTGVGDLVVTATSRHSRNRRAGILLGRGTSLTETLAQVGMVVEGVETTRAARRLAERYGIEMPITEVTARVLFEGLPPMAAVNELMGRARRHEAEPAFLNSLS